MRLLLFDVDGTLIESRGAGKLALRAAMLEVFGTAGPIDGHDFRGKTDPWIVRELLRLSGWSDAEVSARLNEVWGPYLHHLDAALADPANRPAPCAGVTELVRLLAADEHYESALLTGNVEKGARKKLSAAGLGAYFGEGGVVGAFGSDSERRADLPPIAVARASDKLGLQLRVEEAVIVGDTPEDVRCARANGARVVLVGTGGYDREYLQSLHPDVLLDDFSDTGAVLEALAEVTAPVGEAS